MVEFAIFMLLDYSSLMLALAAGSAATALTLLVSWLGNRRDSFLLVWSVSTLVIVGAIIGFGVFAANEASLSGLIPCVLLTAGLVINWGAARLFRCDTLPLKAMLFIAGAIIGVQVALYAFGFDGLTFALANLASAVLLSASAREYWQAREEKLASLFWLVGLYLLIAASFVACAVMILIETPLYLNGAPQNWAETLNVLISIFGVTGIGALSLALNQERLARDHHMASRTDALTGLLNRRALEDLYGGGHPPETTAVIVFDLDHFKTVNDVHGHAHGDEVLRRFTRICRDALRKEDVAARVGGEEFVVVLPDRSTEEAAKVAERIRARFAAESIEWDSAAITCTVSAGVHGAATEKQTLQTLLHRADEALYAAKNEGRNRVCLADAREVA